MARSSKLSSKTGVSHRDLETLFPEDGKPLEPRFAATTLSRMAGIWKLWIEYCGQAKNDPIQAVHTMTVAQVKRWIFWFASRTSYRGLTSFFVAMKTFRCCVFKMTGTRMDPKMAAEMKNFINMDIRLRFNLTERQKDKPTMDADDLAVLLDHHWMVCHQWYPTERERIQLSLLLLLVVYTAARPGTLLESPRDEPDGDFTLAHEDADARADSLKYKDIELFNIKDPTGLEAHVFMMRITLRLMKGYRNKGAPSKFVFYERDDNLAFCPILHILSLAFADEAFASPLLRVPQDLFSFVVPQDLNVVPLEWNPGHLEMPIFRRSEQTSKGYTTSSSLGWQYQVAQSRVKRLGKEVGFKDPLSLYAGRRGAGNAIDSKPDSIQQRDPI